MKKVYVVYNDDGMEVFTIMKDAIDYATCGGDVYDNQWEGVYDGQVSMAYIRGCLKNWVQISAYTHMGSHFTITPTFLHKRGSNYHEVIRAGVA